MRIPYSSPASGALVLLAVVVSLGGCATKGDLRSVREEIRDLSARTDSVLAELQRQRLSTADSLRTQSDQIVDLQGSLSQQLRRILDELATLRQLTGANQRAVTSMRDRLESLGRAGVPSPRRSPTDETPSGSELGAETAGAQAMYSAAVSSFNRNSFATARLGFERFLESYPNHDLAPRVHYYLADILEQEGDLEEAVTKFEEIPELFPGDPKVPDALWRIGLLYLELEDTSEARRYLERVVNTYPNDPMAELAQRTLDEIGG